MRSEQAMSEERRSVPTTMSALTANRYGGPEVLEVARVPVPAPQGHQVLVEVAAAGLDRGVFHLLSGSPYVIRPMFGLRRPRQPVPGLDLSGVVVAVDDGVTRFAPGDEVFGIGSGTFAEYALAHESKLARKPSSLTHSQAGVLPISGSTALQAIRDVARIRPGEAVAVFGASGGVGSYAVQIAKAFGADVTGVARPSKAGFVRELGADRVIDADGALDRLRGVFDVVLFAAGGPKVKALRRLLVDNGRLVVVGAEDGGRWLGLGRQATALALSPFVSQKLTTFFSVERAEDVETLGSMAAEGEITPQVHATYPLVEAAAAFRELEGRRVLGKVAITAK